MFPYLPKNVNQCIFWMAYKPLQEYNSYLTESPPQLTGWVTLNKVAELVEPQFDL